MFRLEHAPARRTVWVLLFAGAMLAAACGSSASDDSAVDEPAERDEAQLNAEPSSVMSDDGMLTLDIPAGAMPAGTEVSIRRLPSDESPDFEPQPATPVYDLEPSGLQFAEPLEVTLRQPVEAVWNGGLPVLVGALSDTGGVSPTGAVSAGIDGDDLVVETTIEHFSQLAFFEGNAVFRLEPPSYTGPEQSTFEFKVVLEFAGEVSAPVWARDDLYDYNSTGSVRITSRNDTTQTATAVCAQAPGGEYSVEVNIADAPFTSLAYVWGFRQSYSGTLSGAATCTTESGDNADPPPESDDDTNANDSEETDGEVAAGVPDDANEVDDESETGDPSPSGDFFLDDPIGDWSTLSGQPAPPDAVPAVWDIDEYTVGGTVHTVVLAGPCPQQCLDEMRIAGAQLIARRPDGGVEATVILQKNDDGTFEEILNGNPALIVLRAEFNTDSVVFDADGSGLPDGIEWEVAIRGSRTSSIDDGAEDVAGPFRAE